MFECLPVSESVRKSACLNIFRLYHKGNVEIDTIIIQTSTNGQVKSLKVEEALEWFVDTHTCWDLWMNIVYFLANICCDDAH